MKSSLKLLIVLFVCLFLLSCQKKYLGVVPILDIQKDISLPIDSAIVKAVFPTENIGYCLAQNTNGIYKTIDGGETWAVLASTSNYRYNDMIFLDSLHGFVVSGSVLVKTKDGGLTWTSSGYANFIGMTEDSTLIAIQTESMGSVFNIRKSSDKGATFQDFGQYDFGLKFYDKGTICKIQDSACVIFVTDGDEYFTRISLNTGDFQHIDNCGYAEDYVRDIYLSQGYIYCVGVEGLLCEGGSRDFFQHRYEFRAIDGYDDLIVAVGEKTIVSNLSVDEDVKWNELNDKDLNNYSKEFYFVKFYDAHTFYVGGEKGLLWKVKI